jgi:hypothetical protein
VKCNSQKSVDVPVKDASILVSSYQKQGTTNMKYHIDEQAKRGKQFYNL